MIYQAGKVSLLLAMMASFIIVDGNILVPEGYNKNYVSSKNMSNSIEYLCKDPNDNMCLTYSLAEFTDWCGFDYKGNNFTAVKDNKCATNTACTAVVTCQDPKNIATLECKQLTGGNETRCDCYVFSKQ